MGFETGIVAIIALDTILLIPIVLIFLKGYKKSFKKPASG